MFLLVFAVFVVHVIGISILLALGISGYWWTPWVLLMYGIVILI